MFSKIFKELREEKNTTQKDLAKQLNVTDRLIRYYESGERMPPADILGKIADYFNVSIDYLVGRTDTKQPIKKIIEKLKQNEDFTNDNLFDELKNLSPESQKEIKKLIELYKIKDMQDRNTEFSDEISKPE